MTATTTTYLDRIASLLAEKGYEVSPAGDNVLRVREVTSGVVVQAALQGEILFLSLTCITVPDASITAEVMRKMLAVAAHVMKSGEMYEPTKVGASSAGSLAGQ